jgi:hypothetical protein
MAGGPSDGDEGDEGVVRPEDLDFTRDESVAELQDSRYDISTDRSRPPDPDVDEEDDEEVPGADDTAAGDDEAGELDVAAARERLARHVSEFDAPHGFALTAAIDGELRHHEAFSTELPAVFDELVTWYATRVGRDTPPAEVLGILLLASDRPVRFPVRALGDALDAHDLTPDDSIADLLRAVDDEGFAIPTED